MKMVEVFRMRGFPGCNGERKRGGRFKSCEEKILALGMMLKIKRRAFGAAIGTPCVRTESLERKAGGDRVRRNARSAHAWLEEHGSPSTFLLLPSQGCQITRACTTELQLFLDLKGFLLRRRFLYLVSKPALKDHLPGSSRTVIVEPDMSPNKLIIES
jgi:hypothetical protein